MTVQQILFGVAISVVAGFAARLLIGRARQWVRVRLRTARKTRKQ